MLSVFQRLNADENLYALVFGESVLNDAVAITLYRTFLSFLVWLLFLLLLHGCMSSSTFCFAHLLPHVAHAPW